MTTNTENNIQSLIESRLESWRPEEDMAKEGLAQGKA